MISFFNESLYKIDMQVASALPQDIPWLFREVPLDIFGQLLLDVPEEFPNIRAFLPTIPPDEVQIHWTGACGKALLMQSLAFTKSLVAGYSAITGQSLQDARILDYGCGWGRLIRLLYQFTSYEQIFAVDPWSESIQICKDHNVKANLALSDRLPSQLPFDCKFNLIFAFSVFTHLSEKVTHLVLNTLRRYIVDDGLLAITVRPKEYWYRHDGGSLSQQMLLKHNQEGFAFTPHAYVTSLDGDVPYGDASIALEYFQRNFPAWLFVGLEYNLIDANQIILFFKPQ